MTCASRRHCSVQLDLWRAAVGQMNWEERANAALDLLIVSGGLAHRASGAEPWREW